MDEKDRILLRELQADSSRTNKEIAEIVGVAGNTLSDRIKRLRDEGYIRRIGAVLNPKLLDLGITAIVLGEFKNGVKVTTDKLMGLAKDKRVIDGAQISEVHTLFGRFDVVFKVRARDNEALEKLINILEEEANIQTETIHVATSILENAGVVLNGD